MNKALLVIDMPESCDDCDFCYYSDGRVPICFYKSWVVDEPKAKPDWCPLKRLPKKKTGFQYADGYDYVDGWNDCIDKILGN